MAAVILEPKKIKSLTVSLVSPSAYHKVMALDAMILFFWMLSFKPTISLSSFTFIKRLFSSLISAIRLVSLCIWGYCYFSQQSWFQLVLHPAQHFSWCTLHIKLNKLGDGMQPWHSPSLIWSQSVVPLPILTVDCWPAYRFLRRQVRWSDIPICLRIFYSLLWSTQSKA